MVHSSRSVRQIPKKDPKKGDSEWYWHILTSGFPCKVKSVKEFWRVGESISWLWRSTLYLHVLGNRQAPGKERFFPRRHRFSFHCHVLKTRIASPLNGVVFCAWIHSHLGQIPILLDNIHIFVNVINPCKSNATTHHFGMVSILQMELVSHRGWFLLYLF